jgi:3-oxoacyl-[acyl-carrier protein] reductase
MTAVETGLNGKRALVTAASRGIGFATARALLREGCRVVISSSSQASIEKAAAELSTFGEVTAIPCDLTEADECADLVDSAIHRLGGLDVLITNCAGPPAAPFEQIDEAPWRHAFDLVLMSAVRLCQAALPALRRDGGGVIVCLNSHVAKQPMHHLVLSNALRPAVAGLAKTLSQEAAPEVRVNCIGTGWTLTDRVTQILGRAAEAGGKSLDDVIKERAEALPLRRMATPDEIANAAVFLASDAASFINGATLDVDGGENLFLF